MVNVRQFADVLGIDPADAIPNRISQFVARLAYAGEDDIFRPGTHLQHAEDLAAADAIESGADIAQRAQDIQIAIRLDAEMEAGLRPPQMRT